MEMPDKIYAIKGITNRFDGVWDDYQWADQSGTEYHHDRILKAKDAEIASLHLEIDECHKRLNRWADAHNELIGEVELRKRVAELEAILQARGE